MIQSDYTLAKLYNAGGDLSKPWYVYYSIRNLGSGRLELQKEKGGINYAKSIKERTKLGTLLVAEINSLLRKGWRGKKAINSNQILTLQELLTQLLETKKGSLRRRTWQSYKYALDVFKKWMKEKKHTFITPQQFTNTLCHNYTDWLQSERKLKGRGFNSCKNNLSVLFNMMVDREIIVRNPLSKIKNMKEDVGKNIAFSDQQRDWLSQYLIYYNFQLYLFTQFIYFCYIRPLELLRLRISNVDLKQRTITIYGSQSKNRNTEVVVIPDAFIPLIAEMNLEDYPRDFYMFGPGLVPSANTYARNSVTKRHTEALKDLKMPEEVTMYSWKHTGVVNAYKAGIDIYSIMRQCRHSSINQTQKYLKSLGLQPTVEFASKMK